jgi:hypothetical protein
VIAGWLREHKAAMKARILAGEVDEPLQEDTSVLNNGWASGRLNNTIK